MLLLIIFTQKMFGYNKTFADFTARSWQVEVITRNKMTSSLKAVAFEVIQINKIAKKYFF